MSRLEVRSFGTFAVTLDGRPLERWRAGKARGLFQLLLVHRNRWMPRRRLHEELWPDHDDAGRGSSLKVAVHAVRRVLTESGDDDLEPAAVVEHEDGRYRLRAEAAWLDADEFELAARSAREAAAAGDRSRARTCYARVVELYQGDFLADETADWVVEHREWCRSTVLHALHELSRWDWEEGVVPEVLSKCRRMLEIDPLQEQAYQNLMIVHARCGEPGRVRQWYELCARRLRRELDVDPAERTERILDSAMSGQLRSTPRRTLVAA